MTIGNSCDQREMKVHSEYFVSLIDSCNYYFKIDQESIKYLGSENDYIQLSLNKEVVKNGDLLPKNKRINIKFPNRIFASSEIYIFDLIKSVKKKINFLCYLKVVNFDELAKSKDNTSILSIPANKRQNGLIYFPIGGTTVILEIYGKNNKELLDRKDFFSERPILNIRNYEKGDYEVKVNLRGENYFYSLSIE